MSEPQRVNRRDFLGGSLATVGVAGAMAGAGWGPLRAGAANRRRKLRLLPLPPRPCPAA